MQPMNPEVTSVLEATFDLEAEIRYVGILQEDQFYILFQTLH